MHNYDVFLTKCGLCHVMGDSVCGTHSVTVDILLNVFRHFNLSCLLHVCMHAAFLVALFSFLHMSNLVPIIFFSARMFPTHPPAQFCKFTAPKQFNVVSALLRFLYHSFLTRFCALSLLCLVIYTLCQRPQIRLCYSF